MPRNIQPSRRSQTATARNKSRIMETARLEDVFFGKVIKNLGGTQMLVKTQEGFEALARIPGALAHRSATPIRAGDLVILLPWDFEVRADKSKRHYEIFAVIHDRKLIRVHINEGRIPEWMLDDSKATGEKGMVEEGVEFDYGLDEHEDDDALNIDEI